MAPFLVGLAIRVPGYPKPPNSSGDGMGGSREKQDLRFLSSLPSPPLSWSRLDICETGSGCHITLTPWVACRGTFGVGVRHDFTSKIRGSCRIQGQNDSALSPDLGIPSGGSRPPGLLPSLPVVAPAGSQRSWGSLQFRIQVQTGRGLWGGRHQRRGQKENSHNLDF